jgi:hypothetical protein
MAGLPSPKVQVHKHDSKPKNKRMKIKRDFLLELFQKHDEQEEETHKLGLRTRPIYIKLKPRKDFCI